MRGYNLSPKPRGAHHYRIELLTRDVVELIGHLGEDRAHVVGHDWGGYVAWATAMRHPQAVNRLAILNAPHPATFLREVKKPEQLKKSSYQFFFQLPYLPERAIAADDFKMLRALLSADPVRRGAFRKRDIELYVEALAQPGALTATLNYYRAAWRRGARRMWNDVRKIDAPTLVLWGEHDRYLGVELTHGLEEWTPNLKVKLVPNATHWVQHDAPAEVNASLIEFFRE
jgi:pimeloyl-ACP methyl ester carboxylesterase